MNDKIIPPQDDRLLTEREVAERWGISAKVMSRVRIAGGGPPFIDIGNSARYKLSEVLRFECGGLISKQQLANRWGITIRAIDKRAVNGMLPSPVKLCGAIRYKLDDIEELESQMARTSGRMRNPVV